MSTGKAPERIFLDQTKQVDLITDLAYWNVELSVDADGHLNILVADGFGTTVSNIRNETNGLKNEEVLLRYTSMAVEDHFKASQEDE